MTKLYIKIKLKSDMVCICALSDQIIPALLAGWTTMINTASQLYWINIELEEYHFHQLKHKLVTLKCIWTFLSVVNVYLADAMIF